MSASTPPSATSLRASADAAILQYVVDNIPHLVFWKDKNSVYLGCNKNFAALDGKSDPRALIGRTDFDMAWKEHAHLYRAGDLATMTLEEAILDKEEVSIDPAGNETVILTSKVPLRDAAGEVTGLLGIIVDITARKRLETELARAKEAADRAGRAKSDFIANVTHELRTPLTLILGPLSRVLSDPGLGSDSRRLLESAHRNGFRLYNLVNDVLDFSKAEATEFAAHREPLELVGELCTLIDDMRPQAENAQLELEFSSELERLDLMLDPKLVERMLVNLIGNALKFTPAGGRVRVELRATEELVAISVADTGIGIPEAALHGLFEKFMRVDSTAARRQEGTGLGLPLVRHFAQALGGRVEVKSELGKGSEFTLLLPLQRCAPPTASPSAEELGGLGQRSSNSPGQRSPSGAAAEPPSVPRVIDAGEARPWVLVAEDNADLRYFTMETLAVDFSVVGVANGAEAWQELGKRRFDVVVSDLMMPVLDGLGLTERIKAHPALRALPVVLVTARGGLGDLRVGLDAGADDYLCKPFAPEELLARVRAAYRMRRLQEQLREQARSTGAAVATHGILHNVGNILNGVSVAAGLLERPDSPLAALERLGEIWAEHCRDVATTQRFLTTDERGQRFGAALLHVIAELRAQREDEREEARAIGAGAAHALAIIARQLEPGSSERLYEVTDVGALLRQALVLSAASAPPASAASVHTAIAELPALYTDGHALLQVFMNLLCNAQRALAEQVSGPREIYVLAEPRGERIVIEIRDTGAGIAESDLPRLFQQGFSTRRDGHGLGLHMSRLSVQSLGGSISGTSPGLGRGATFTVTLPVGPGAGLAAAAAE
ncbi:MAG TPA: ATP-binding protein [Polyangiaceae bacterium]|nr:ATP-binding protein [Polyangiaceae bacterium]